MRGISPVTVVNSPWFATDSRERVRLTAVLRLAVLALAITLAQTAVALVVSMAAGNGSPQHAYRAFCRRDGFMYAAILSSGYQSTIPPTASTNFDESNVAFFPGYPLAGRLVHRASGGALSLHTSLVIAAQIAAWGFWTYLLLFLRRFQVSAANATVIAMAAAVHPAGFFLDVAYSESLFLVALLGFLFWITSSTAPARWVAVTHGFVMSATRLGGLPLAFAPIAAQLFVDAIPFADALEQLRLRKRQGIRLLAIGMLASLGGLAFFGYCQWRFGAWDLYFQTQREGQGVAADWLWFVRPSSYVFFGSVFHPDLDWTDDLSRLSVAVTVVLLAVVGRREWRLAQSGDEGWRVRLVFYLCAAALLFIHAAGVSPKHMQSMLRYAYPVHLLLLLALAQWAGSKSIDLRGWFGSRRLAVGLTLLGLLQLVLAYRYFQGGWVA